MNKELEKVMIEDVEYSFDPEKEYIKDGHAYCKVCNERKDGKALEFFGKQMIFKTACKCDRDREAQEKERQKQLEIERLSWCVGHLIQMANPNAYDEKYAKWNMADLPIIPSDYKYEVAKATKKQGKSSKEEFLEAIENEIKEAVLTYTK